MVVQNLTDGSFLYQPVFSMESRAYSKNLLMAYLNSHIEAMRCTFQDSQADIATPAHRQKEASIPAATRKDTTRPTHGPGGGTAHGFTMASWDVASGITMETNKGQLETRPGFLRGRSMILMVMMTWTWRTS